MLKSLLVIPFFIAAIAVIIINKNYIIPQDSQSGVQESNKVSKEPNAQKILKTKTSIFIPYWFNQSQIQVQEYERLFYFGIAVNKEGIVKEDSGYKNIDAYLSLADQNKENWITVRMTNTETNLGILKEPKSWEKISQDILDLVKLSRFNGLLLDLELNSLPFNDTMIQINNFVQFISERVKKENLKFAITLYGDTLYRKRPYDLNTLKEYSDEFILMAYDLHKVFGEPGPNFPLKGKEKYGYDLQQMTDDISQHLPKEKLTVVFGMYGYNWIVDEKKRPISKAKALSLNEINGQFLGNCEWKNCLIKREELSGETEINYIDENLKYHIVWFEDQESVRKKMEYLKEKGVVSFAYWAYGYF